MTPAPEGRRVAVVTGGGAGIGAATVDCLLEHGYAVTALDVRFDQPLSHPDLDCKIVDLRDEDGCRRVIADIVGDLVVLVNCAAVRVESPVLELDADAFRTALDVNVVGAFTALRAAAERMVDGGSIVNVSSAAAYGKRNLAAYGASKAALISLTTTAALELAERGIRVNVVLPGTTDTAMLAASTATGTAPGRTHHRNTVGRVLAPREVAEGILRTAADPLLSGAVVPVGLLPYQW
jgi:3-oxoacyl-[acyl-carrier protein] reductase